MNYTSRQIEIIESAGKLVTQIGISGLTTKNLANEIGFAESAIYRHFSGKQAIISAMLSYIANSMDIRFNMISDKEIDSLKKLSLMFSDQIKFFMEKPFFVGVIFPDGMMEVDSENNIGIKNIMAVRKKYLHSIIAEGQNEKLIRNDLSPVEIAHILMGSFRLLVLKWRLSNFDFDISKEAKKLLSNLFKIIKP